MTEILHLHGESVVRKSHEHDIINSSQSVFIKESIVSFSLKLSFKNILSILSFTLWHSGENRKK